MFDQLSILTSNENVFDPLLTFGVLIAFAFYSLVLGFRSFRRLQAGAATLAAAEREAGAICKALASQTSGDAREALRRNKAVAAAPVYLRRDLTLFLSGLVRQPEAGGLDGAGPAIVSVATADKVLRDNIVDEGLQLEQASRLATHFVALAFALSVLLIAISLQVASASSAPGGGQTDVLEFVGLKFLVTLAGLIAAGVIRMASERFGDRAARSLDALRAALDEAFAPINATAQALLDARARAQRFDAEMTAIKTLQTSQQKALVALLAEEKAVLAIQTEMLALQQKTVNELELERTSREELKSAVDQFVAATDKLRNAIDEELEKRITTLGERVVAMGEAIQTSGATFERKSDAAAQSFKTVAGRATREFYVEVTQASKEMKKTLGDASNNFYTNMAGNQQAFAEAIEGRMRTAGLAYVDTVKENALDVSRILKETSNAIQQSWNGYLGFETIDGLAQPIGPAVLSQIETSFGALAKAASDLAATVGKIDEFQGEKPDMEQLIAAIDAAANRLSNAHREMWPTVSRLEYVTKLSAGQQVHDQAKLADDDGGTQSRDTEPRNTAQDNANRPSDRKHSDDV